MALDSDVAAIHGQPIVNTIMDKEAVAGTTAIERHHAAGDIQIKAICLFFGIDHTHARAVALGIDVERAAVEGAVVVAGDGERGAVADDEVDDFTAVPDAAIERDAALDDIRAGGPPDASVFIRTRCHALGHFGVLGHGLLVAVHIDVRHGIVCPRHCRREHHHKEQHRCPSRCAQP